MGGLGVIGRNLLDHLAQDNGWDLVGLSRRARDFETRAKFISVDLLDRAQCDAKETGLLTTLLPMAPGA